MAFDTILCAGIAALLPNAGDRVMALSVTYRGLTSRFGEKLRKLTQLHKDRPHDNNTFDEWYEILRSTARGEGVSTVTLASANDSLKELFERGLSASEALDRLKKYECIRNTVREDGI
jgi:hypothetical protein